MANPTAPLQKRSVETLGRIVSATEELLRTKSFEEITIREIVGKAGCPIASFYARFKSRDDLLPHLYESYNKRINPSMLSKIEKLSAENLDLGGAVESCVDLIIESYTRDRWLMREVALFARRNPQAIGTDARRERSGMHTRAAELFATYKKQIRHKNPVRAAEVGIFIVASVARETILFGAASHAAATGLTQAALRHSLIHTLHSFLTQPCASPHLCCSSSLRRSPGSPKA